MHSKINISPVIREVNLDDLRPASYNPRTISEESLVGLYNRKDIREVNL